MLLRPRQHRDEPSWAHLRLQVQAAGFSPGARASPAPPQRGQRMIRSWLIQRADQGGMEDQGVSVQLDEVTGRLTEVTRHAPSVMPVASQLAVTAPR